MVQPTPIALSIAGSDPSGGAGIQADLKTFTAFKVYGTAVLTALTAQNTRGVDGVMGVPPEFITQQIASIASDLAVAATKTGMLGDTATVQAVAGAITRHNLHPLVVDPVMVATSGDVLLERDAIAAIRTTLLPLADLLTPNLHEAAKLSGEAPATDVEGMARQGAMLLALGSKAVLVKGGHGTGDAIDVLVTAEGTRTYSAPRLDTRHTHGTGCTLSAAIAAGLARGRDLDQAVTRAKAFVWDAMRAGQTLGVGSGNGPLDHNVRCRDGEWGQ